MMTLFKKKYKRSKWFEGLLEAEEVIKDGFIFHKNDGCYIWFKHTERQEYSYDLGFSPKYTAIAMYQEQRCQGVEDYLHHMHSLQTDSVDWT